MAVTINDEHREFLENLRQSGIVNMWSAGDFLQRSFDLTDKETTEIFLAWKHEKEAQAREEPSTHNRG